MLLPIPMALRTIIAVIAIFIFVLVIHLVLFVAFRTCPRGRIPTRMALCTIAIRFLVVNRERMIKRGIAKRVRVVTI